VATAIDQFADFVTSARVPPEARSIATTAFLDTIGVTLAGAVDPLRDWAEENLKDVLAAQRRYDAQQKEEAA